MQNTITKEEELSLYRAIWGDQVVEDMIQGQKDDEGVDQSKWSYDRWIEFYNEPEEE